MPKKNSTYEKVVNRCVKCGWKSYPPYQDNFNYDKLYKIIMYSEPRVKIGIIHSPKTWEEYYNLVSHHKNLGSGVSLNKMIFTYGEFEGREKFKSYCEKQAYTNSFEYKNKKYGMTLGEFNDYNKSRAVTLENLIDKYGEILGKHKFKSYCDRQAYTNSEEYLGTEKFREVNRKKSHTLEVYVEKYGEELGNQKFFDYCEKTISKSKRLYSNISQTCFEAISKFLTENEIENSHYATKNGEYFLYTENRIMFYDFVCKPLKFCIEYHGDHYHGNPKLYRPDDYLRARGVTNIKAKEKWKLDETKIKLLKDLKGYDTIIIWDLDWRYNKELVIERIQNHILELRKKLEINYES